MELLIKQILEHKEAAALPSLLESGGLPALISGLSAVHRANLAAALRQQLGLPLFVICPDDTAAENFANDLRSMLGAEVNTLTMRDFVFYQTEAVSRQGEQKRIATLYRLAKGMGWWPDEQPSEETKRRVERLLDVRGWQMDLVLTHTCPLRYKPLEALKPDLDQSTVDSTTEEWMDEIELRLRYARWYCGHFHTDKTVGRLRILFREIVELEG